MVKKTVITPEGLEKLKVELKELKSVRRPEVISRIKTAKELGDLSENAEYTAAKEDQSFIEGRIQELEQIINNAKVINHKASGNVSAVEVGSAIEAELEGDKETFEIVGPAESDPVKGKISSDSPVGRAFLGRKKGDKVVVQTPDGAVTYHILKIS